MENNRNSLQKYLPSVQGLIGGVLGSAVGYEISEGNPIGAGLGMQQVHT